MKKRSLNQKQKPFFVLVGLVVLLLILENLGVLGFIEKPVQAILKPAQIGLYKSGRDVENFFSTVGEIGSVKRRKNELERENALLTADNARLKKLEEENKTLREQLGAKVAAKDLILAAIIGTDPLFTNSQFILDKGKGDGVKEGSLVILKDILIGQIASVGSSTSNVRLLNDPETKIPAVSEAGAKGILEGEFGTKIALVQVAQSAELKEGQIVFTSGEAGFPEGLVLGKIVKVSKNPAELFQKAAVEPLVPFGSLDFMFIIK